MRLVVLSQVIYEFNAFLKKNIHKIRLTSIGFGYKRTIWYSIMITSQNWNGTTFLKLFLLF